MNLLNQRGLAKTYQLYPHVQYEYGVAHSCNLTHISGFSSSKISIAQVTSHREVDSSPLAISSMVLGAILLSLVNIPTTKQQSCSDGYVHCCENVCHASFCDEGNGVLSLHFHCFLRSVRRAHGLFQLLLSHQEIVIFLLGDYVFKLF